MKSQNNRLKGKFGDASIFDSKRIDELKELAMKHFPQFKEKYKDNNIDDADLLDLFQEEYDEPIYLVDDTIFTKSEYETAYKFGSDEFKNAKVIRFKNIFEAELYKIVYIDDIIYSKRPSFENIEP